MKSMSELLKSQPNTDSGHIINHLQEKMILRHHERINNTPGVLTGYDCPKCLNKGYTYYVDADGYETAKQCECLLVRQSVSILKNSGLAEVRNLYTLENYTTDTSWRQDVKYKANKYINAAPRTGNWFYFGGQSGSGKTHICAAIANALMDRGYPAKYMLWRDEVTKLKQHINDANEYARLITPFKTVRVLLIDDLFKRGNVQKLDYAPPSDAEVSIAFEIINTRINSFKTMTIISTELLMEQFIMVDEATASRVFKRAGDGYFALNITKGEDKNWRLKSLYKAKSV